MFTRHCYTKIKYFRQAVVQHTRIPEPWTEVLHAGLWTLNAGPWTLNASLWTLGSGHWALSLTVLEQNQKPVSYSV